MTDHDKPSEFESERANLEAAEAAARAARIEQGRADAIVQQALARAAELRRAAHEATLPQQTPAPQRRPAPPARTVGMSEAWTDYISQQIDKRDRSLMRAMSKAIAETVVKDVIALEKRCAALEAELAEMRQERGGARLRAVASTTPGAMIA